MAHAYTPGLLVTERVKPAKKRILPLKGDVLVKVSGRVRKLKQLFTALDLYPKEEFEKL